MKIKRNYYKIKRNPGKVSKMVIQRNTNTGLPKKNIGGFLPNPPKNCLKKEHWVFYNNTNWIDLSICHYCSDIKQCIIRQEYLSNLKKIRDEKLELKSLKNGKK